MIDAIENEFEKLEFLVDCIQNDPKLEAKWTSSNKLIPKIFHFNKTKVLHFRDIFDVIKYKRTKEWFFYMVNLPPKDVAPKPLFCKFVDGLKKK